MDITIGTAAATAGVAAHGAADHEIVPSGCAPPGNVKATGIDSTKVIGGTATGVVIETGTAIEIVGKNYNRQL